MEKEQLSLLIDLCLNQTQIAKKLNLHRTTIKRLCEKFDLKLKNKPINTFCKICKKDTTGTRWVTKCQACNTRIRRYRTKFAAIQYKGGKCNRCGWSGSIAAFEFHHLGENKEFVISSAANKKWEVVKKEIDKCELLCSNCHRIEHCKHSDEIFIEEVKKYNGRLLNLKL